MSRSAVAQSPAIGRASDIARRGEAKSLRTFIDGRWVEPILGRTFEVRNPATGDLLALVPDADRAQTRLAVEAAARAFPAWSRRPAAERAAFLLKVRELVLERRDELARLLALEEGKPIAEARGEVLYAADFLGFFAEEGERCRGEVIPSQVPGKRLFTLKQPVGVAGLITIWNFPAAGITRPLAPALAAGCTVVVKPPEQTPLSAIALFELFEEVGLPAGVANLVTTWNPAEVGRELVENPSVRKLSFTGSAEVGKLLMRGAADQVKRVTLELGGHAPLIVFEDADLESAARGAVQSKFRNAGQTCIAANRIYVQESVFDSFAARFVDLARGLKIGNPLDETVQIGPLIDEAALEKVQAHVEDALARGGKLLLGGGRRTEGDLAKGFFFEPTVLSGVAPDMRILREETFGPVAPLVPFTTEEEVLALANELPYGLAAFFYTRDASRAMRVAEGLEYGIVGVNDPLPGAAQVPFGGVKQSGIGKEGGRLGLEEFLDTKLVSLSL
jgi:succinate-semialdehyde dehydrogenase/glutarate-semialdehyde dehydrogenase